MFSIILCSRFSHLHPYGNRPICSGYVDFVDIPLPLSDFMLFTTMNFRLDEFFREKSAEIIFSYAVSTNEYADEMK